MFSSPRRPGPGARLAVLVAFVLFPALQITAAAAEDAEARHPSPTTDRLRTPSTLPERLPDSTFWALTRRLSEAGGDFQSDNFASNEMSVSRIAGELGASARVGGVYIGVGPEQNFTYIAALRPRIAFLVDIRRQAIVQHLMYKAVFEMSRDRADFLSLLFAKPRPAGLDTTATVRQLWAAFWPVRSDSGAFDRNLAAIRDRLVRTHGFALSDEDQRSLEYVYRAFFTLGPVISYGGYSESDAAPGTGVNFATLTMSVDAAGVPRSFLATEAGFRVVQQMHMRNLIVPVVADFSGPSGLRAIGRYLRERHSSVTAFYVSNVEQHLFQADNWRPFYANVAHLPVDSASVFIRPALYYEASPVGVCPVAGFLQAYGEGRVGSYAAALRCGK